MYPVHYVEAPEDPVVEKYMRMRYGREEVIMAGRCFKLDPERLKGALLSIESALLSTESALLSIESALLSIESALLSKLEPEIAHIAFRAGPFST